MFAGEIDLETVDLCVDKRDGSVRKSSKIGSSKRDRLSKISVPIEIEEAVETLDGVLVKATWGRSGVSIGVDTVVEDGARREGEGTVGGAVGDSEDVADVDADIDTVPVGGDGSADIDIDTVGVREREDGDEYVIGGDSLDWLSSMVLSRLGSREVYAEAVGRKIEVSKEMSGPSGKAMD
jgi:hypothetical protein